MSIANTINDFYQVPDLNFDINKLRQDYRNMSDEELDKFSVEMVEHFLDNIAAQERAKIILTRKGII